MKRFKLGEIVRYRPLECMATVISINKEQHSITLKLSANVETKDLVDVLEPFTLVEHLSE